MSSTELAWFKSSYSGSSGDNCIEVAALPDTVLIRDSKDTQRHALAVSAHAWTAFMVLAADSRI